MITKKQYDNRVARTHNSQFATMAGKRLRLNVFGELKVRSSIAVYRLKSATAASWSDVVCHFTNDRTKFNRHKQTDE